MAIKYYSDLTEKFYRSEEQLLQAESEFSSKKLLCKTFDRLFEISFDILTDMSSIEEKLLEKENYFFSHIADKDEKFMELLDIKVSDFLAANMFRSYTYDDDGKIKTSFDDNDTHCGDIIKLMKALIEYYNNCVSSHILNEENKESRLSILYMDNLLESMHDGSKHYASFGVLEISQIYDSILANFNYTQILCLNNYCKALSSHPDNRKHICSDPVFKYLIENQLENYISKKYPLNESLIPQRVRTEVNGFIDTKKEHD